MAIAEAWFFVQLTIFVSIWTYVLNHCPAGRSNDDPGLFPGRGSQIQIENVLVFQGVYDAMCPNKVPRALENQRFLHKPTLSVDCWKAQFSFHQTIEHGSSQRLENSSCLRFWWNDRKLFFSGMPSK